MTKPRILIAPFNQLLNSRHRPALRARMQKPPPRAPCHCAPWRYGQRFLLLLLLRHFGSILKCVLIACLGLADPLGIAMDSHFDEAPCARQKIDDGRLDASSVQHEFTIKLNSFEAFIQKQT